jgi:hypothetical protein
VGSPELLAAAFVAESAADPRPWLQVFREWAPAHELTEQEQRDVRVLVIRRRVFGAVERSVRRRRRA